MSYNPDGLNFRNWRQRPPLGDAHTPYDPKNPLGFSPDDDPHRNADGTHANTYEEYVANQARITDRKRETVGLSRPAAIQLEKDRATFYKQYLKRYEEVFAKIEEELRQAEANEFAEAKAKAEAKQKKESWWLPPWGAKQPEDKPPNESSSKKRPRSSNNELSELLRSIHLPHNASKLDIKKEHHKQLLTLHTDKVQQNAQRQLTPEEFDIANKNFNEMKDKFDRIDVLMKLNLAKKGGSKYNKSRKTSRRRCRK